MNIRIQIFISGHTTEAEEHFTQRDRERDKKTEPEGDKIRYTKPKWRKDSPQQEIRYLGIWPTAENSF
jgi:hypothetical protein